jgi:AcrR family transcriptional regulator
MDVALKEFLVHGYSGANLDRIAARCGISKTTIYRQVGAKDELFASVGDWAIGSLRMDYQAIIDAGGSSAAVIGKIVRLSQERSASDRLGLLRLAIAEHRNFPSLSNRLLERTVEVNEPVAAYLQQTSSTPLSPDEANRRALILMCMAAGGFLKLLNYCDAESPAWVDDVVDIFLNGFG